jgi:hypothetical protein
VPAPASPAGRDNLILILILILVFILHKPTLLSQIDTMGWK